MSIDVNVQNDLVIVTESSEDITVNVSNAAGPAGVGVPSGGTAGQILKKLSNTNYDTYWALDGGGGVPYSGATGDVDLGEFGLSSGYLQVDTTPTNTPTDQGTMYWDDSAETVALVMNGTVQKIGEDLFYHVTNQSGSSIPKGTAVRFAGTDGNSGKLLIAPFIANGTYPSFYYMGITSEAIANGDSGKVYEFGKMRGINTSAYNDGDILYASTSVAGGFQTTAPVAPNNIIVVAAVVNAANNGTLMIRTTISDAGISGTGATGQVSYWNGTSSQTGSNNLFWDNANARLGIGTNAPAAPFHVTGSGLFQFPTAKTTGSDILGLRINTNDATSPNGLVFTYNGNATSANRRINIQTTESFVGNTGILALQANGGTVLIGANSALSSRLTVHGTTSKGSTTESTIAMFGTSDVGLYGLRINVIGGATTADRQIRLQLTDWAVADGGILALQNAAGNVTIGQNSATSKLLIGTASDGGQRLQVIGDAFIKGSGATSGTVGLTVQNSSSTNLFRVYNDGYLVIGNTSLSQIFPTTDGATVNTGAQTIAIVGGAGGYPSIFLGRSSAITNTFAGTQELVRIIGNFTPTSGGHIFEQLRLQSTINQTGGANGITRGLYVNPTLTAAADWRSIEWSNNSGWGLYGAGTANNYLAGSLGIGTNTPATILDVNGGTSAVQTARFLHNVSYPTLILGTSTTRYAALTWDNPLGEGLFQTFNRAFPFTFDASAIKFMTTGIVRARIFEATGNLVLQNGGTFTDAGYRLDVNGTARVSGNVKIGNTSYVDSNSNLIIGVNGATARAFLANDSNYQDFGFAATSIGSGNINSWSFGQRRDTYFGNTIGSFQLIGGYVNNSGTSSTVGGGYRVPLICNPNGDVLINGGNANVVNGLIGLKVNSPTAHVDITASTTSNASLRIRSGTAPTTPNDGDIWFDGTDLKMRIGGVTKTFTLL